jgi:3-oxoacyl-[acyl-carrier-protein] synthase-3
MTSSEIAEKTGIPEDIIVQKFGVKSKPVPGGQDTTRYMGIQAARNAIADARISPEDIDLVIWNGAQHKDSPCWLAGLKVANKLGATNAWSFDMEAMCGSMMAAMQVTKSMLLSDDEMNTVLLVTS